LAGYPGVKIRSAVAFSLEKSRWKEDEEIFPYRSLSMHEKKQKARTTYGNTNPRGVSITLRMLTTRYDVHVSLVSLVHAYSDGRTWWMEFSAFLLFLFKFLWLTDPLLLDLRPCTSLGRMAVLPHFPSDIVRVLTVMVLLPSCTFCNFLRSLPGLLLSVTLLSFSSNYFI